jgi:ectoine hydroxylase-related dioxygenase (phytanoyl-CoA dioxygenase family)
MTTQTTAPAATTRAGHLLTREQVEQFDRDGFLVLRNRIDAELLGRLQEAAEEWVAEGNRRAPEDRADWLFANRPSGRVMYRVDYIHAKSQPASLELLGSPAVLGIAESLAGRNFVPTYESMVFKSAGDGAPIPWHQDAVHGRNYRLFNIDVYLDASVRGRGALYVVPGSQRQRTDACAIAEEHGWDLPGAIEVEMAPGDVLVHDDMIVHGSPPAMGNALRRTIYFEFRAAEAILDEGPWTPEWMDARLRLIPAALAEHARHAGPEDRFEWRIDPALRPVPAADAATELRIAHEVHTPGEWCSAGTS